MRPLVISTPPFKPTFLSIPPSPFSPRLPVSPPPTPPDTYASPVAIRTKMTTSTPPPPEPLRWLWQCHICHNTYSLGVTRRCLEDGHFFCAGVTPIKKWRKPAKARKVKRHKPCASEFDYQGWKNWGTWRRHEQTLHQNSAIRSAATEEPDSPDFGSVTAIREEMLALSQKKDCWNKCDYPSECRWGRQIGVHTPKLVSEFVEPAVPQSPPPSQQPPSPGAGEHSPQQQATFDDILGATALASLKDSTDKFWSSLVASATRRKSTSLPSPLALSPVMEEADSIELVVESPVSPPDESQPPTPQEDAAAAELLLKHMQVAFKDAIESDKDVYAVEC